MKRITSSDRPLGALTDSMSVKKPYLYLSTSISRTRATVSCTAGMALLRNRSCYAASGRLLALPRPLDQLAPGTDETLDVGTHAAKTKAYADRALRKLRRKPHRAQHMRGLDLSGRAGAPCADRDAGEIEPDDERLGLGARHRDAARIREPRHPPRHHHRVRLDRKGPALEFIPESGKLSGFFHLRSSTLGRDAEAGDGGDILGAGAPAPLLASALDQGLDWDAFAQHKSADALGSADLVRRKRHHIGDIGAKRAEIERQPAGNLNRIGVQNTTSRMDDLGCGGDRLDGASLIVGRHQRNERPTSSEMVFGELFLKHAEVDNPIARHGNSGRALAVEPASGEYRRMLNRRHITVPGLAGLSGKRQRIRLAAPARENHIVRLGSGKRCDLFPRRFEERPRLPALSVHRGGIAVGPQRSHHSLAYLRPKRSCGVIIEIRTCRHASEAHGPEGAAVSACTSPHRACYEARPEAWIAPSKSRPGASLFGTILNLMFV